MHSCPRHDWMRLRERLRALLAAASPRFKTRLSTNWNKTKYACGDHSKREFPTSKQNCLEQKDNIFTEQAPPSENACNHGFRTWLPYVCLVIPLALRLSWPTVTVVSEGRVLVSSQRLEVGPCRTTSAFRHTSTELRIFVLVSRS